LKECKHRHIG